MFNDIIYLLKTARQSGINITTNGTELQLKMVGGKTIDQELLQQIKDNKKNIIDYLNDTELRPLKTTADDNEIKPIDRGAVQQLSLSFGQERMWFIDQMEGSVDYHIPVVVKLQGQLNVEAIAYAIKMVVERHESLRSVVRHGEGDPYQQILPVDSWALELPVQQDITNEGEALQQQIDEFISRPFNISTDYMLRAKLFRIHQHEHTLVVVVHHISADGWSAPIVVDEVARLYTDRLSGRSSSLPPLQLQYADYAMWQRQHLQSGTWDGKLQYWKKQLQDVKALELPTDFARPLYKSSRGSAFYFDIDADLSTQVNAMAKRNSATLFMTLIAAFKVLLYRYTSQTEICVGTPIAGRTQSELGGLIGFFVNTLALKTALNDQLSFADLLQQVKEVTIDAYENQEIPFEKVVESVVTERDLSRSPLFQAMFVLQNNTGNEQKQLPDLELSVERQEKTTSKFDITLFLSQQDGKLEASVEYSTDLFKAETIERLAGHFTRLLRSIVQNPQQAIGLLNMLGEAEIETVLYDFNQTAIPYPSHKSLTSFFEDQVAKTPGATALVFDDVQLTYNELNERINRLANYLRSVGVKANSIVPICVHRSIEMIVGVIGILKAGGGYLPLDPDYPIERINFMVNDADADVIITTSAARELMPISPKVLVVELDNHWSEIEKHAPTNPADIYEPHHLVYLIYTSGSTGQPKGVKLHGGALVNLMCWQKRQFSNTHRHVIQFASLNFDVSFVEIFSTLCFGSTLYLIESERRKDLIALLDDINRFQITHLFVPYIVFQNLADVLVTMPEINFTVEEVIVAGEQLKLTENTRFLLKNNIQRIVNQYGPSEAHVVSSFTINKNDTVSDLPPIGKSIDNTQLYILSDSMQPVPVGVLGELYIGGVQVGQGYLNRPEHTAEKFIPDIFSNDKNDRLYKTGDLSRWLPDGNIEFLGRKDEQVKIRGNRVEPGEIETILQESSLVRQAIVLSKPDKTGNKRLIAYVVAEGEFDKDSLVAYLKAKVPSYMMPAIWIHIENVPLTANGKVNKRVLPEPELADMSKNAYVAPADLLEEKIATIWEELLGVQPVGVTDNFFDLGGHSLLVARVIAAMRSRLKVEVSIKDLFVYTTIRSLASYLRLQGRTLKNFIIPVADPRPALVPLSFSQERLWFIDKLYGSTQYHLSAILKLKGSLNKQALLHAFRHILSRHQILRTVIVEQQGERYQQIKDGADWVLNILSLNGASNAECVKQIENLTAKPFNLSADFMLRSSLINVNDEENILVVTVHHIASDGWSASILVKELIENYSALVDGRSVIEQPLLIQYADYAIWQRNVLKVETLSAMLNYWQLQLANVPTLALPTDFARPPVQSSKGSASSFCVSKQLTENLRQLSRQQNATLFMTLFSAFNVLMQRYSNQNDICIGTSVANRNFPELEGLVGFFINTLAIRTSLENNPAFTHLLQQVKQNTLEAFANQDVPLQKVVEVANVKRDSSRNPLFQVLLTMQNNPLPPPIQVTGLTITTDKYAHKTSQLDIICNLTETSEGIDVVVEYCTDLFTEATIIALTNHFNQLLLSIVAAPQTNISLLQMLKDDEQKSLLTQSQGDQAIGAVQKTISALFEQQVLKTATAQALVYRNTSLTFELLNAKANQLAHLLSARGVTSETLVAICLDRSPEMLIAILAVLKAGGAYVPIDPGYPKERIDFILTDSNTAVIITNDQHNGSFNIDAIPVILLDADHSVLANQPVTAMETRHDPHTLAYVIYTSGSTGKPKGVMVEQAAIVNYLVNKKTNYSSNQKEGAGSFMHLSYTFDASLTAMFMPLLNGRPLVISSKTSLEVFEDENLLKYAPYDFIKVTPAHLGLLQPKMNSSKAGLLSKKIVVGGEALFTSQVKHFAEGLSGVEIINEYGPTEASVGCSVFSLHTSDINVAPQNALPIGKPIDNVSMYIIGADGELLPQGAVGEIAIGGAGLARGYINNGALTNEKFVLNPFGKEGSKMYKTGDLARWLPGGNIEYIGRKDDQVKIRGYRVELGEIEAALLESEWVSQAVVLAKKDSTGGKRLVGYIVPAHEYSKHELLAQLKATLPDYMIPSVLLELETLPLTINGKVDRKALPEVGSGDPQHAKDALPSSEAEWMVCDIWKEVLELDEVGVNDDFFDLGGHSLLAFRLISLIRKQFKVEMQISEIFNYPTIRLLANHLQKDYTENDSLPTLPAIEVMEQRPQQIPLSFSQERLWFIDQLEGGVQYHVPAVLRTKGQLNAKALAFALQQIVNRHHVLRTVIKEVDGQGFQHINEPDQWQLGEEDFSKKDQQTLDTHIRQLINKPFKLQTDHMLRANLIRVQPNEHILVFTIHHIASDGWSASILVKELVELYKSFTENQPAHLQALPVQYADFALWQRQYLQGNVLKNKLAFWKDYLQNVEPLQLPTDHVRPAVQSTKGASISFSVDKDVAQELNNLSRQQNVSIFMTLLAAFNAMLYRYTGQHDICVGTPIAGRQQPELEGLIGFFLNTLALRSDVSGTMPFTELLQQVRVNTLKAFEHQDVPFEKIVEAVVTDRELSRNPLFQVMFILQNTPKVDELLFGDLELSYEPLVHDTTKFDLTFGLTETEDGFNGVVEYGAELFEVETINKMIVHFKTLLASITQAPQQPVGLLPMLSAAEKQQLLVDFNNTDTPTPHQKSIADLFEEQAAKTGHRTAVTYGQQSLTYSELNERSNKLAHYLRSHGVQQNTLVPVCIERSLDMMVAVIAILKAGGAYVPIDPEFPEKRITHIINEIEPVMMLTSKANKELITGLGHFIIIEIDGENELINQQPATNLQSFNQPDDLAYLLYTSGSTGVPKGVKMPGKALVNLLHWQEKQFTNKQRHVLQFASLTFDVSFQEIFSTLCFGGTLFLIDADRRKDVAELLADIVSQKITHLFVPYIVLKSLADSINSAGDQQLSLEEVIVAGEQLKLTPDIRSLLGTNIGRIVNQYGPTEAHVVSSYTLDAKNDLPLLPPIGKPIDNTKLYIVDEQNHLVPVGVPGQLFIGGVQVAAGYQKQPQLTAEKFIKNFITEDGYPTLYKTGDVARWLPDGNIEYIGRADDQVKIRGYRVEIGEIEMVLQECSLVEKAVVITREDKTGGKQLVGYVVAAGTYNQAGIVAYLKANLPAYMVPALWVQMASIPVTTNGKVNRKALPDAGNNATGKNEYVAPQNEVEEKLASIWSDLLGVKLVGITDNFFELGGHSLLATRVVSAIRNRLRAEVSIKDLFVYPEIRLLADHLLLQGQGLLLPSIKVVVPRPEHIPLSFSQERLWFIDQLEGSVQYHVPSVLRLTGQVNRTALSASLKMVIKRHEALRTVIRQQNGQGYQFIQSEEEWDIVLIDGAAFVADPPQLKKLVEELINQPFNLARDYMLRAHVISLGEDDNLLVVNMHHIASDGWSASIIVNELIALYEGLAAGRTVELAPLPIQYADYAIWQRNFLQGSFFEKKLGYWKNKLNGVATLQLPTDFSRPPVWSPRGANHFLSIDKALLNKLHELSRQSSGTLFMTLLAAFKMLLHRYSGQQDICVGTPIAGRQQQELEGLIGFFVNTLAIRTQVVSEQSFSDLLERVRIGAMEAFENQEVPFEKVVDEVVKERDVSRNPLFQVMIVLLNLPEAPVVNLDKLTLKGEDPDRTSAKFDLQLFFFEKTDGLSITVEYCTDLFTSTTIIRMMDHFKELLSSIVSNPQQKVSSFSMLAKAEEHELLVELNNTLVHYPKDKNVVTLFEEQVIKTPGLVAVAFNDEQLTYSELNKKSNQLAHYLLSKGVEKETLVSICLQRSLQMIVAIWGVLKAGAAYVPIDPDYPEERIRFIVEDTSSKLIITTKDSVQKILHIENAEIVELDSDFSIIKQEHETNPAVVIAPHHLAYVIYTSGSTGKPKGVMNEHGGLANRLYWAQQYFTLTQQDVVLQKTTFCFDVSVWELLWPSLTGAKLVFAKPGGQKDNTYLKSVIEENKVTLMHFVPSMLEVFLPDLQIDDCSSLKKVLCSGEALKPSQVELFIEKLQGAQLHNLYGPTEAAIDVTCWSLSANQQSVGMVPIGKPVANTKIYILNEKGSIVPRGGIGEIHIGGIQVARGYLNQPHLTAKSFIPDPFGTDKISRLYKTGDLGRWMQDGNIEYLGRIDEQVKIRGYRIELGEIESVLRKSNLVNQSVVVAKTDKVGTARLVGYYTPDWEAIKGVERSMYQDRIDNWKELYNTEYATKDEKNIEDEFNLIGWNSSFTGEPIPAAEMKQWVEDIVEVILSNKPECVLEIGCGTGLIYYPLAGKLTKYIGTDLSRISIGQINERIAKGERDYGPSTFITCAAHEVVLPEGEYVDTVILNSIVQYFPGEDYLSTVIANTIELLNGSGTIIIGDVRDGRMLKSFKGRLQSEILQDLLSTQEFKWVVDQEVLKENELCIDPAYFLQLQNQYPDILTIELRWKLADYTNELSQYRYTVIIHLGNNAKLVEPTWQSWQDNSSIKDLVNQLENGQSTIAIKDVPNPRLWKDKALKEALSNNHVTSLKDILYATNNEDVANNSISEVLGIASAKGYHYRLLLNGDPFKMNIIFEKDFNNTLYKQSYTVGENGELNFTNVPLFLDINRQIQKDIRLLLQKELPEYMIPAEVIAMGKIPLTDNGKADRKFLRQREERGFISTASHIPPSSVLEHQMATIWKDLLGTEQIGIDDNFFEFGGDSILTIQIVSRLKRLGYELQPKDVFIHQTIRKLSHAITEKSGSIVATEQGVLTGPSGLLPIQQWHLQGEQSYNSHFNQAVLLGLHKDITEAALSLAIQKLVEHHDALRFIYRKPDNQWHQQYGNHKGTVYVEDLRDIAKDILATTITEKASAYQKDLNIELGDLMRVVLFQTPSSQSTNRLLIIVHHLAIDGVSWRILLEDIELLLTNINDGGKINMGNKSSSYRQWYQALEAYGLRRRLTTQLNYWQKAVESCRPLPVDINYRQVVKASDVVYENFRLDAKNTTLLLQEVPRVYHTEINDLLLAALAVTLCKWGNRQSVTIGVEGHGREDIDAAIDTTRTIGWFTSLYPLLLELPKSGEEADIIQTIKEQLRRVPDKGLGFGVLKYLNNETSLQTKEEPWDIMFNYLGQLDNVVRESKWLSGAGESSGNLKGEEQAVREKILMNCSVRAGELAISLSYSSQHYNNDTIKKLAAAYLSNLQNLIVHCIEQQKSAGSMYTPSDYGLGSEIAYNDLNVFLSEKVDGKERRSAIEGLYRLSGLQEGMLFHGLYDTGIGAYTEQFVCDLAGLDMEVFKSSWAELLSRHSVLRSAFYVDAFSVPVQCVYKEVVMPLVYDDIRKLNKQEQAVAIKAFDKADWDKGFNFKAAPLMRIGLLRLSDDKYRMLWTSHHILFDGWSFPILMEEFLTIYEAHNSGTEIMPVPEDRYEDYIRYIERSDKELEEDYWRKYLGSIEHNTLLPFVNSTAERNKGGGIYQSTEINLLGSTAKSINNFAQRNRLTLNTIMQGVWAYLLHQYTGSKEVVYGIIVSGRPDDLSGVERRVGMYINTLPFRTSINEADEIVEWLRSIQSEQLNSRQYQHTPFSVVQGWSGVQGDLFDTLLTFENYPFNKIFTTKQWALSVSNVQVNDHTNYPLSIVISSSEVIHIKFSYNAAILNELFVKEIRDHFENVLLQIISNQKNNLSELTLLTTAEEQQLFTEFNHAQIDAEYKGTVVDLFKEQAVKMPDSIAVIFNDSHLTFKELDERSNQLANCLKINGVTSDSLVPLFLDRSLQMLVGAMGIMKAGAAYVPIDPNFPEERIAYILNDTGAGVIVTDALNTAKLPQHAALNIICIEEETDLPDLYSRQPLTQTISGNDLAYIIYTSGSTGKPKGVMIEHHNLVNYLLNNKTKYIKESNNPGSYIHLSYTFDASVSAMFMPLINGKAVVVGAKQSIDIFEDKNFLKYAPYDFIKITPAHLELIQPKFLDFKQGLLTETLVIGGEALYPEQFDSFVANAIGVTIINEYGPTEATVGCTTFTFNTLADKEAIKNGISIGSPIDNATIYIVRDNSLVPVGIKGEIWIGGPGVARGYLNLPGLSNEKFISNPFTNIPGDRIYKTGDVGRWLPDGNIEYLGRIDDQVKIRGYRIEPGEIEAELLKSKEVSQGVVIAKQVGEGDKRLVSYYTPDATELKAREMELQFQRVASWKELYETEYGQTEEDESIDSEFNIIGWNDSFTGGPIPAAEMKEWLADIVQVVLSEGAGNVLEIGCGTGLIYYQLAGKVNKYIGADLSRSSIKQIKQRISKELRDYGPTELFTAPAHEVDLNEGQQVDTILLNSMIQYFPGEHYLNSVLNKCFTLLQDKGRIIIGDVRDNRLLESFKTRLRLQKLQDAVNVKDFKWGLEQALLREEELCVSPAFFHGLKDVYPQITHVEIIWKQGDYINELTLYRYTVVIYVNINKPVVTPKWKSWNEIQDKPLAFSENDGLMVAIKDVPNPRLGKEIILQQALQNVAVKTVGDLTKALNTEENEIAQLRALLSNAKAKGYSAKYLVHENHFMMNLLLEVNPTNAFVQLPAASNGQYEHEASINIPLFTDIGFLLQADIKSSLLKSLPDYMVPSDFVTLRQLPLTINGKVDRLFLSQVEEKHFAKTLNYLAPSTSIERSIADIWKGLLHLEKVGIDDNFFDIGGHSLLAMRVISAIRRHLQVELNIKDLFTFPTIQLLAGHVQQLTKGLNLPIITAIADRPAHIPLSFSQERLWFIDRLGGSVQYHIPSVLQLTGTLNIDALQYSIQQVVKRHEVLRTIINDQDGTGYQQVQSWEDWKLETIENDLYKEDAAALQQYIQQTIEQPFDLGNDYMLRATLIELDTKEHLLVATLHHIASDGWSTSIMVTELAELYNSFIENKEAQLPQLPVQYADYALWQRTYLQGGAWDKKLDYWKQKLHDTAALQIPTDYKRPPLQSNRGALSGFRLSKEVSTGLQQLSQQHGATMFMTLLAAFKVLMYRYSGQSDICVGTPIAGRQQSELEGLIGFFVNTLALRTEVNGNDSFEQLLQHVRTTTLEAYDHQEVPFEKVVELSVKDRDMSRSPLFQVMFVLQNTPEVGAMQLHNLQLSPAANAVAGHVTSKFDLTFSIMDNKEGLAVTVEYCTDLYKQETINQLSAHFVKLLQSIVSAPQKSIGTLPMLSVAETDYLLHELNNTAQVHATQHKTVVQLFEEQVKQNPAATALIYNNESLTYGRLNERANQLANYLVQKGVTAETLVPVCMQRSATLIIALLAIMKAGGAYVPIDAGYPDERVNYMLHDTGASMLLTNQSFSNKNINTINEQQVDIVNVDLLAEKLQSHASVNPVQKASENQLAYVIYTSGSTGKPKGVMVEHKALMNLIGWHTNAYGVTQHSRATAMAGVGFDAFGWEIWPYLSCGASLLVIDDNMRLNPQQLLDEYISYGITHSFIATALVPGFVEITRNNITGLQYVLTGGDALGSIDISGLDYTLVNNYGPTENTVVASYYPLTENTHTAPSIGKAVGNTAFYLLSEEGELVPHGAAGELCISGESLARGYLNNPVLTSEKFVKNVYNSNEQKKLYKTGDLCRWLPGGNLEYLGRKDEQVKIRGYRIELGEIENTIQQSGLVQQAVVVAITDQHGAKQLAGYLVIKQGFSSQKLVEYLTEQLPVYMVPRYWKELDNMPLTVNGKVDKKALPPAEVQASAQGDYVAPGNEMEEKLSIIWQELLGVERVGIFDNFFELGGHSLMVMRMVAHIEKTFFVSIPIKALFQFTCISDLSNYLQLQSGTVEEENARFQILDV